jgi:predicted nucleic acid-binding protein
VITAEHSLPKLPDPDDEAILAAALAGKANVFVTGDKALLNLESVEGLPIITPRGLWESLADE